MLLLTNADARHIPLAGNSVNCVVTSPPYYGLRDYGVEGQIGLEETPDQYVANMVQVFRELWRVLKTDGTAWLNLGDSYFGGGRCCSGIGWEKVNLKNKIKPNKIPENYKPKDIAGIPWRVAFALQSDGWYLRQDIIWHKPNPMPESVRDRCTKAHEYIFLLAKSARYYYDADSIAEPCLVGYNGSCFDDERDLEIRPTTSRKLRKHDGTGSGSDGSKIKNHSGNSLNNPSGLRNKRSVWTVATTPYSGAHFATFPPKLIEPCILAGCPPGGIALDPFCGTATAGRVAVENGRRFVGLELNRKYIELAIKRTDNIQMKIAI